MVFPVSVLSTSQMKSIKMPMFKDYITITAGLPGVKRLSFYIHHMLFL